MRYAGVAALTAALLWPEPLVLGSGVGSSESCREQLARVEARESTAGCRARLELRRLGGARPDVAESIVREAWTDKLDWGRTLLAMCVADAVNCHAFLPTAEERLGGAERTPSEVHVLKLIRQSAYLQSLGERARLSLYLETVAAGEKILPDGSRLFAGDVAHRAFREGKREVLDLLVSQAGTDRFADQNRLIRVWKVAVQPQSAGALGAFVIDAIRLEVRGTESTDPVYRERRAEAMLAIAAIRSGNRIQEAKSVAAWLAPTIEDAEKASPSVQGGSRMGGDVTSAGAELSGDVGFTTVEANVLGFSLWEAVATYERMLEKTGEAAKTKKITTDHP